MVAIAYVYERRRKADSIQRIVYSAGGWDHLTTSRLSHLGMSLEAALR